MNDLIPVLRTLAVFTLGLGMSPVRAATLVYVGNADSQDISVFQLGDDGDLARVANVPVPGPTVLGGSLPLAVSPDKKFLYAALRNQPYSVVTFSIDGTTGKLTYTGTGPLAGSMAYIVADRSGRFLLAASYDGDRVTVNPIAGDGVVGVAQQIVPTLPHAHCILPDPQNRHVLHTSLGGDVVYQEIFDENTGRLSPGSPPMVSVKAHAGPRHLVFSPSGKFVYVIGELDGSITVFPYDAKAGSLKARAQVVSSLPAGVSGKPWAADVHVTPDGKLLYASERTSSTLAAFRVDPGDGTLKSLGSYPTARQPRSFQIDPSGRYLISAGQLSNSVIVHSIEKATGKISILREHPAGKNPTWVEAVELH